MLKQCFLDYFLFFTFRPNLLFQTPIIKCKRMEFNFFEGMKYAKFQPIPLASLAWNNRGSNGDYFTLYEVRKGDYFALKICFHTLS